ncbi:acyltransferase [Verrucomicrobium sp. BvORR034]|uniref:acyltransferase family protein n=1 Tax=Verrucomicrobium sp. BvORR034 TaxID=1396418 RepID=UPI00067906D2|nr:acyltransferase [Verrucomicrobium sp. BvORR034]
MLKSNLPFVDVMRGLAILGVFLFHALGTSFGFDQLKWEGLFRDWSAPLSFLALYPFTYGSYGVAIFFVVSGFCIHLSHIRSNESGWLGFFCRRFFRIYPPYLFAVATFFFVWPWGSWHIDSGERIKQLASHVLSIHNLSKGTFFGINPSFWSIGVELQLYLIYPALLLLSQRFGWKRSLIVTFICEILIRLVDACLLTSGQRPLPMLIAGSPFAYWFSWSLGGYIAQQAIAGVTPRLLSRISFPCVAGMAVLAPFAKPTAPFSFLIAALGTGVAFERLLSGRWQIQSSVASSFLTRHLVFLGMVSYSFYLIHQPVLTKFWQLLTRVYPSAPIPPLTSFALCCAMYPCVLATAYLAYRWIESPSIAIGTRLRKRLQNQTTVHASPSPPSGQSP